MATRYSIYSSKYHGRDQSMFSNLQIQPHFDSLKVVDIERLEKSVSTRVTREMCKMWTNFAKHGEPTPTTDASLSVKWNAVRPPKDDEKFVLDYLEIDKRLQMLTDPGKDRIIFWRNLFQKWNGGFLKPTL